ncbi:hypothetical protein [Legionella oakridgensis]|uniref:Uncharacterized protein n=2 Tax=Legionella oakridgensis TaxID=29423 RepID=W0BFZ8_9GAMM|nr:hypothetical protein [Legionella oakridgensis]AHE67557.1 hypothetical protein Loa_02013 [Legionella oakridgensis ATCC 33761 = DSM 21215]ETO92803.1 hypothetical protein LOR_61c14570 [Legionella oakridgensis RV-2-2007]KTD37091.1 hypothetical protein Loak_2227 [Legionella oakridgensis]STY20600.1 Uncharacterised protein [Legionella longbeachae]
MKRSKSVKRVTGLAACCFFISVSSLAASSSLTSGHGAFLYDSHQNAGPASSITNDPGQWVMDVQQFNAKASAATLINRLYVYSGDIEMTCTTPSACVYSGSGQNVFVGYEPPAFGQASVAAYRANFPDALILAIIDGDLGSLPLLNNDSVGKGVANLLTQQLCADPNVDGVFFDLEPFSATAFQSPGLFALYNQTAKNLKACIDPEHPHGRVMGVFANPNKIADWSQVKGALSNNGFLAVAAYDINDTTPPRPTPYSLYTSSVTGKIQTFMDPNSKQYQVYYTVAIPAASSFSEFEQFGYYNTAYPDDFQVSNDFRTQGFTQLAYVQAARAIILKNSKSPYYLGKDYWSWNQYISPAPKQGQMLLPNIPSADVVEYLQQRG